MKYYLLLIILFNSSGEIRDIIHLDTIFGLERCTTQMNITKEKPSVKKGTQFACVPVRDEFVGTFDHLKSA